MREAAEVLGGARLHRHTEPTPDHLRNSRTAEPTHRAAAVANTNIPRSPIKATLSEFGKTFSETPRTAAEIKAYSAAMADMFCAYISKLAKAT